MTRADSSIAWATSHGRAGWAVTLLALAISSGCGARPAPARSAAPEAEAEAGDEEDYDGPTVELDNQGCLEQIMAEPSARGECGPEDDSEPCVAEVTPIWTRANPPLYVCFALTRASNFEGEDADGALLSAEGTYVLAVLEHVEGAWKVRARKEYRFWKEFENEEQFRESEEASIEVERVGPDAKAVVVTRTATMGGFYEQDVTFHLVTSRGLTEIFSFSSSVDRERKVERSHVIDEKATTAGHHDIVVSVDEESFEEDGEAAAWKERYRWNGKKYEQVERKARD